MLRLLLLLLLLTPWWQKARTNKTPGMRSYYKSKKRECLPDVLDLRKVTPDFNVSKTFPFFFSFMKVTLGCLVPRLFLKKISRDFNKRTRGLWILILTTILFRVISENWGDVTNFVKSREVFYIRKWNRGKKGKEEERKLE